MAGKKLLVFPKSLQPKRGRDRRIYSNKRLDNLQQRLIRIQYLQTRISYLKTLVEIEIKEETRKLEDEWRMLYNDIKAGAKITHGPLKAFFKYAVQFGHSQPFEPLHKVRERSELVVK